MSLQTLDSELDCAKRAGQRSKVGAPAATTDKGRRSELRGVPVLIVEDDGLSAKLLFLVLTDEGCDVRVARTAEEAIAILQVFSHRLVVLDLVLPKMGGVLLAQKLKGEPSTRDVVIIAITSFDGSEAKPMAIHAGCADCVQKPIDTETFAATVAHHLRAAKGKGGA